MVKNHPNKKSTKVSFRALPDEVRSWTEMAEADGRSLSNWIRLKVNKSLEDHNHQPAKNESEEAQKAGEPALPATNPPKKRES